MKILWNKTIKIKYNIRQEIFSIIFIAVFLLIIIASIGMVGVLWLWLLTKVTWIIPTGIEKLKNYG